jgi:hypothetical protein
MGGKNESKICVHGIGFFHGTDLQHVPRSDQGGRAGDTLPGLRRGAD